MASHCGLDYEMLRDLTIDRRQLVSTASLYRLSNPDVRHMTMLYVTVVRRCVVEQIPPNTLSGHPCTACTHDKDLW